MPLRPFAPDVTLAPLSAAEFAQLMAPLGPFGPAPRLAVAVSGGADSMALALLAAGWAAEREGAISGLVVDHGLRPGSAEEAALACARLAGRGVAPLLLTLRDLRRGAGLAERARHARYAALRRACAGAGILHLLLGHHAADQAETMAIRELSRSGPAGLAGMAALVETPEMRLLRPLLPVPPGRLRATLRALGAEWSEDPSNRDMTALRTRLRAQHDDPDGCGPAIRDAWCATARHGRARETCETAVAGTLARRARIYPEGFSLLTHGPIAPPALAALLRLAAGRGYPVPAAQVARLARHPGPATLGGARVMAAGRLSPGNWLLLREEAAMAPPVAARPDVVWDHRFRLHGDLPPSATIGALAGDAAGLRRHSHLPASVLRTLPAIRVAGELVGVPHLRYWVCGLGGDAILRPEPPVPACAAAFVCAGSEASWMG